MAKDLFDLDSALLNNPQKDYEDNLKHAKALCIRGQYDRALDIYNSILDEDFENEEALIGVLRVHSHDFTIFDSDEIKQDIHAIEAMCPNTMNEEYLAFLKKRKLQEENLVYKQEVVEEEKPQIKKVEKAPNIQKMDLGELKEFLDVLTKAKKYCSTTNWKKCMALLEPYVDRVNDNPDLYYCLGFCYLAKRKYEEAISHLEKCLKLIDNKYRYYYKINFLLGVLYSQIGVTSGTQKKSLINTKKAKQHFLIAKEKEDSFAHSYKIDAYINSVNEMDRYPLLIRLMNYSTGWDLANKIPASQLIKDADTLSKQNCPYGIYYYGVAKYYGTSEFSKYQEYCLQKVDFDHMSILGIDILYSYLYQFDGSDNPLKHTPNSIAIKVKGEKWKRDYFHRWDEWED